MEIDVLREELRERVIEVVEPLGLKITFESMFDGIPAFKTNDDSRIIKLTQQLSRKNPTSVAFGTEGPFYNSMGLETVVLGPGSIDQAHQQNEFL
ncbi:MAG: acetylornithine deacetylase, partial [Gammaproteobacteria bacterium]